MPRLASKICWRQCKRFPNLRVLLLQIVFQPYYPPGKIHFVSQNVLGKLYSAGSVIQFRIGNYHEITLFPAQPCHITDVDITQAFGKTPPHPFNGLGSSGGLELVHDVQKDCKISFVFEAGSVSYIVLAWNK